jgi:hypothetical protein
MTTDTERGVEMNTDEQRTGRGSWIAFATVTGIAAIAVGVMDAMVLAMVVATLTQVAVLLAALVAIPMVEERVRIAAPRSAAGVVDERRADISAGRGRPGDQEPLDRRLWR